MLESLSMNIHRYFAACLTLIPFALQTFGQQIPIGSWRDELPYTQCISVTEAGNLIYTATPYSVFYVDKTDNSVQRLSKINGLSDIGISCISYNNATSTVVLTYTNANIDLIRGTTVTNISDIKRKQILGNKTINSIYCYDKYAYLACGFGIVVLDLEKDEIKDTYYIGVNGSPVNVLDMTTDQYDTLYAASEQGIYKAYIKDPAIASFANWRIETSLYPNARFNTITTLGTKVIVNKSNETFNTDTLFYKENGTWHYMNTGSIHNTVRNLESAYNMLAVSYNYFVTTFDENLVTGTVIYAYPGSPVPLDAIIDKDHKVWIGDYYSGLISYDLNTAAIAGSNLSGPLTANAFSMACSGNDLYIVPGGKDASVVPLYSQAHVYHFDNTNWTNLFGGNQPVMWTCHDAVNITVDPYDPKHIWVGTWGSGLLEISNDNVVRKYGESNSTLRHHSASDTADVRVSGSAYDKDGNLWVATSHTNDALSVMKGTEWTGINIPQVQESDLGQILVDRSGQKWIIMRYSNLNPYSLMVFDDSGTPGSTGDDKCVKMNTTEGNGALPGTNVFCMAEDHDGEIWIGTEKGVAVFYSPESVFSGENYDAQKILVEQGGYYQYLLENESATAMAVDGANRKWIGTDRGGVFLFSPDGTKEIYHFTEEDSPLFSNRITSIAINNVTGEVYFGTDKGVISFKSTATEGGTDKNEVYAYPNPVKPGYSGYIAIKGLVQDAQVKITDISGVLIYSTRAEGGQAIWDGNNFNGKRAQSGVYLVFASDESGNDKVVTKILFIN
jgi:hypothetical protein